jgi:hypothetical protein
MAQFPPPSLLSLFEPPEDFTGNYGLVCGYSADVSFMLEAVERFAKSPGIAIGQYGRFYLDLMLDSSNPPLSQIPGVRHLLFKQAKDKTDFRLMHAKVAILYFTSEVNQSDAVLRLIVSTGNWTSQTVNDSIDLFWKLDLNLKYYADNPADCADFRAAWSFFRYLKRCCQDEPDYKGYSETFEAKKNFENMMTKVSKEAKDYEPRFIDNRNKPFIKQLAQKIKGSGRNYIRNYICLGSGFFEGQTNGEFPKVLAKILTELQQNRLLKEDNDLEADIVVNSRGCQAVATSAEAITKRGKDFTIRSPFIPNEIFGASVALSLHAKFIFCANYEDGRRSICGYPWVYLGSGNLTGPGFTTRLPGGNLEAGVIFKPEDPLYWQRQNSPQDWISNRIPVDRFNTDSKLLPDQLSSESTYDIKSGVYYASPVTLVIWKNESNNPHLEVHEAKDNSLTYVLRCHGQDLGKFKENEIEKIKYFSSPSPDKPLTVEVIWDGMETRVPVMDENGYFSAPPLPPSVSVGDNLSLIYDFPSFPGIPVNGGSNKVKGKRKGKDKSEPTKPLVVNVASPVREMMRILECIAVKQMSITKGQWQLWCLRLSIFLNNISQSKETEFFREWKVNPLSLLREPGYLPPFAEKNNKDLQKYLDVIAAAEKAWGVDDGCFIKFDQFFIERH